MNTNKEPHVHENVAKIFFLISPFILQTVRSHKEWSGLTVMLLNMRMFQYCMLSDVRCSDDLKGWATGALGDGLEPLVVRYSCLEME